jgi:hypothetical protein
VLLYFLLSTQRKTKKKLDARSFACKNQSEISSASVRWRDDCGIVAKSRESSCFYSSFRGWVFFFFLPCWFFLLLLLLFVVIVVDAFTTD